MTASFSDSELAIVRRAYARQMILLARIDAAPRLEAAFAAVRREAFLGPPPWQLVTSLEGSTTVEEPVALYQEAGIVLDRARGVNNGSPSLHAAWLHRLAPRPGETIVHVGAGTGYYTAILAHLIGPGGQLRAIECDSRLAAVARANLADYPNVEVVEGDGTREPGFPADCIYVNFGVERPMPAWIDGLREGGRLIFPLGVRESGRIAGGGFCITRNGAHFAARYLGPAYFVAVEGAVGADDEDRARLKAAFRGGMARKINAFKWRTQDIPHDCWFAGEDWALCHEP